MSIFDDVKLYKDQKNIDEKLANGEHLTRREKNVHIYSMTLGTLVILGIIYAIVKQFIQN